MKGILKKYLILVLTLAVAGSLGFSVYKKERVGNEEKENNISADTKVFTVELREDGFSPSELKINRGDIVTFKTTRNSYFWPASDLHPTHTIYPDFDPKEPVAPTETWSFKFEKVGEWKYHDHLAPYFKGKIIVSDNFTSFKNNEACKENKHTLECWQEELLATLNRKGVAEAFDLVAKFYVEEPEFPQSCHYLSHNIGIAAYRHYLRDKNSVLTPKAAYCANGFYHGFMEALLTASKDIAEAKSFCNYVGVKLSKEAPDAKLQCHHGIGHGAIETALTDWSGGKSEEEMVRPALEICEKTSSSAEELYRCTSGIWNAIANFYVKGEFGLKADESYPMHLCDKQKDEYKESCYGNMNTVLVWLGKGDFGRSASYIEKIPEDKHQLSAIRYLANMYTLSYARGNYERAINACRVLKGELFQPCLEGFAHGFLENGFPEKEYLEALDLCKSAALKEDEREICLNYALNLSGWYGAEKVKAICSSLEERYKKYCK